jgi:hypothetical protein
MRSARFAAFSITIRARLQPHRCTSLSPETAMSDIEQSTRRMSSIAIQITALALACLCVGSSRGSKPVCPAVESMKPEQQLNYLRGDHNSLPPECVEVAIRKLGDASYAPATDVLTSYLDFKVPGTNPPGQDIVLGVQWPTGDKYPAALALFFIRLPAADSLVRAIGDASSSDIVRANAAEVLLFIHRPDMSRAVAALAAASKGASDAATADRLRQAATSLSMKCTGPELRSRCKAALN